jgi:hypothetical protein
MLVGDCFLLTRGSWYSDALVTLHMVVVRFFLAAQVGMARRERMIRRSPPRLH